MNEVYTNGSRSTPPLATTSSGREVIPTLELVGVSPDSEIRCICGIIQDDGFTIQCDRCGHWQHGICVNITESTVPDIFICFFCDPRLVDVERAREIQRKRIEQEARKLAIQHKRSGASHRKKETNGSTHSRNHSEVLSTLYRKPPSPKEQSMSSKSRGRPRPASHHVHSNLPDTSTTPDHISLSGKSPSVDPDLISDSEVPHSVYTKEYSPISSNTIVSPDVDYKIKSWTQTAQISSQSVIVAADPHSIPCNPRRYSSVDLNSLIPLAHSVRWVSSPDEFSSLGLPLLRLVADEPTKPDQFVIEYTGEIGSKSSYIHDTLNQYSRIRHPKPFVLFHPQLPIYIDARRCGSEARFIRRSCRPNLKFDTMIIDGKELRFGLYTNQYIDRDTELTIGWEWDPTLPLMKVLEMESLDEIDASDVVRMANWVEVITSNVGECACVDSATCAIARLKGVSAATKYKIKALNPLNKRRWKDMNDFVSVGRETSPEKQDHPNKRRSSSISSNRKSESRDRTPTFPSAEITQTSVLTDQHESAREARKIKDAISLIDKLANPDTSHTRKKVKRPGAGLSTLTAPGLNGPLHTADKAIKLNGASAQGNASILGTASTADSPTTMNGNRPAANNQKSLYVEGATQTDAPVLRTINVPQGPTCRKKRLIARFRAENEAKEAAKKFAAIHQEQSSTEVSIDTDSDVAMADAENTSSRQASLPIKAEMVAHGPDLSPRTVAIHIMDHDIVAPSAVSSLNIALDESSVALSQSVPLTDSPLTHAYRNPNLHVTLPSTPMFPNAPTTPALQSTPKFPFPTPGGTSASPSSPFHPPSTNHTSLSNTNVNVPLPTPPTGRKKMSLSEYSRRKAESSEKEKTVSKILPAITDTDASETNGDSIFPAKTDPGVMDLDPPVASMNI